MITVKYPNSVPWLPGYAILGNTEAILLEPKELFNKATNKDERLYAIKLQNAAKETSDAIDKMMGVSSDGK